MSLLILESLPPTISKGEVLALVINTGGLTRAQVGKIELTGKQAIVEIPDGTESRVVKALDGTPVRERKIRARVEPGGGARTPIEGDEHFHHLSRLLDLESAAQAERVREAQRNLTPAQAERSGYSLVDLAVVEEDIGLGGRHLVTLTKRLARPLPWTRLRSGDPVVLSPMEDQAGGAFRAVIVEIAVPNVQIALGERPDELDDHDAWRIDDSDDEVTIRRQQAALERARLAEGDRLAALRKVLLGQRPAEFGPLPEVPALDKSLNEVQRETVRFALSARDIALIHGPPGTGKTTTLVEVLRQTVRRGEKILACAPSNVAVDNLFERLLAAGERVVRLGHPARVLPQLRAHTLDLLLFEHPDAKLARKLVKEAMAFFKQAGRRQRGKPNPAERREARAEAKSLLADARRLEARAADHILDNADVICATTTSLDSRILGRRQFHLVAIDEACQSVEPGCWIPLQWGERLILAGDHCQLPPTIISREAAEAGLAVSLFERLVSRIHGAERETSPALARRLTVQYRMHEQIQAFPSAEFYESSLVADESVRLHLLNGLEGLEDIRLTQTALEFVDTAGAGYAEELEPEGESRLNPQEADLAVRFVHDLLAAGLPPEDLAVITPYAAQARRIEAELSIEGLEVDTVDGFQGREKEAIVISLVRSNDEGDVGFLAETRRMNVALTRARRKLIVLGDSATLASHPFYARLLDHVQAGGAYRSVWEFA